jgi:UDP-N-acetylenolpyruvoylglucosamine reductase
MHKYHIELNTSSDIVEFIDICSKIPSEVTVIGKDENGSDWLLSAKSFLCVIVMSTHLQNKQKQKALKADWNTIYVECEEDIYSVISKFIKE